MMVINKKEPKKILVVSLENTVVHSKDDVLDSNDKNFKTRELQFDNKQSLISKLVESELKRISKDKNIVLVVTTMMGIEEYKKLGMKFKPSYIIASCGFRIYNGRTYKEIKEWGNSIRTNKLELIDAANMFMDIATCLTCSEYKIEESEFIVMDTSDEYYDLASIEINYAMGNTKNVSFFMENNKIYITPSNINKCSALRFIEEMIGNITHITTVGNNASDICTLAYSDKAILARGSRLVKNGYVIDADFSESSLLCVDKAIKHVLAYK